MAKGGLETHVLPTKCEMLFEEEAIQERWCEYVGELFDDERGNIPKFDQLEGPEILVKEVENAIKSMKNGKAPR